MKARSRSVTVPHSTGRHDEDAELSNSTLDPAARWPGCWGWRSVLLLPVVVLYGPIVRAAARVPGMERELGRLQAENARVRELSAALDSAESRYSQVRQMMGGEIVPDPVSSASTSRLLHRSERGWCQLFPIDIGHRPSPALALG